jgi:hypothetical protein
MYKIISSEIISLFFTLKRFVIEKQPFALPQFKYIIKFLFLSKGLLIIPFFYLAILSNFLLLALGISHATFVSYLYLLLSIVIINILAIVLSLYKAHIWRCCQRFKEFVTTISN